jgi:hypothetical protein
MYQRRSVLKYFTTILLASPVAAFAESTGPLIQVYKSRTCGCCSKWVEHMREAGFIVEATNVPDVNVYKIEYGVPRELGACHTAVVEGYVVEGHVPADDVIKMLRQKPEITGIAVPGMPMGSPGMETPQPQNYETLTFDADGNTTVWASHGPEAD